MRCRGRMFARTRLLLTFFVMTASSFASRASSGQYGMSSSTCHLGFSTYTPASDHNDNHIPPGAPGTVQTPDIRRAEQRS